MMELLPPTGWGDVATRQQMDREFALVRSEMAHEFALVRSEMAQMEARLELKLQQKLNQHLYATAGMFVTANALLLAAVKLLL